MKYKKICKCCGKEFETNSPQKLYCNGEHYLPCPVCGKPVLKKDRYFTRPPKCCSSKCSHEIRKSKFKPRQCIYCGEWFQPKSGVALVCDKEHYYPCEICGKPYLRTPAKDADGVTTCSLECSKEKLRRHFQEKYGVDHPMQCEEVQKNFHDAMEKKYGVRHALQIPGKTDQQQKAAYITNMKHWGVPYACFSPGCIAANTHANAISKINKKFASRLEKLGISAQFEKIIGPRSYDLYIEPNTLIEINPTYTHNSYGNHYDPNGLSKDYHLNKTKLAESHGYRCIHIWDWDNVEKVVDLLKPKVKIGARKCEIYRINPKVGNEFLERYHLQGSCRGQLIYLGLVYEDELVQLMTFGKPRYNKKYTCELLRLCTKSGYSIVGGASKLFKWALEHHELGDIISYCDRSKFSGSVYFHMGMSLKTTTPPQEVWSRDGEYITANLLRQRGYDQLFGTSYGRGTSNDLLMLQHGWLPIYDCGQSVYEFKQ